MSAKRSSPRARGDRGGLRKGTSVGTVSSTGLYRAPALWQTRPTHVMRVGERGDFRQEENRAPIPALRARSPRSADRSPFSLAFFSASAPSSSSAPLPFVVSPPDTVETFLASLTSLRRSFPLSNTWNGSRQSHAPQIPAAKADGEAGGNRESTSSLRPPGGVVKCVEKRSILNCPPGHALTTLRRCDIFQS